MAIVLQMEEDACKSLGCFFVVGTFRSPGCLDVYIIVTLLNKMLQTIENVDRDSGLLDSQLPDLSTVMTQRPNSRQTWFARWLDIESISRDLGSPNLFCYNKCRSTCITRRSVV